MAKKQKKEMKAFHAAEKIRNDLLTSLNNCTSETRLNTILEKFEKNRKDGRFRTNMGNFTANHRLRIANLDEAIKELIAEKRLEFKPKVVEVSETSNESDEKIIGESEHSEINIDEPQTPTYIPTCGPVKGTKKKPERDQNPDSTISTSETHVTTRQINSDREAHLVRVKAQLDALSDKKAEFIGKYSAHAERYPNDLQKLEEFNKAIQATENIHANISFLYNAYIHSDIELDHFKQAAAPLLDNEVEDVKTLKSHRGFKEIADIVANLLLLIGTVGTVHAAAALYKGKFEFGLFKSATKSGVIVDNLDNEISHVAAASA